VRLLHFGNLLMKKSLPIRIQQPHLAGDRSSDGITGEYSTNTKNKTDNYKGNGQSPLERSRQSRPEKKNPAKKQDASPNRRPETLPQFASVIDRDIFLETHKE
jgi:hypothetical protein